MRPNQRRRVAHIHRKAGKVITAATPRDIIDKTTIIDLVTIGESKIGTMPTRENHAINVENITRTRVKSRKKQVLSPATTQVIVAGNKGGEAKVKEKAKKGGEAKEQRKEMTKSTKRRGEAKVRKEKEGERREKESIDI